MADMYITSAALIVYAPTVKLTEHFYIILPILMLYVIITYIYIYIEV